MGEETSSPFEQTNWSELSTQATNASGHHDRPLVSSRQASIPPLIPLTLAWQDGSSCFAYRSLHHIFILPQQEPDISGHTNLSIPRGADKKGQKPSLFLQELSTARATPIFTFRQTPIDCGGDLVYRPSCKQATHQQHLCRRRREFSQTFLSGCYSLPSK